MAVADESANEAANQKAANQKAAGYSGDSTHGHDHGDDHGHDHGHDHVHLPRAQLEASAVSAQGAPRPGEVVHEALVRLSLRKGLLSRDALRSTVQASLTHKSHAQVSHTSLMHKSHTHKSHTQVSHTQVSHTQVSHTQVSHTQVSHTSLTHKSHMPILRAHVTAHLFPPSCITGIVYVSPFGGVNRRGRWLTRAEKKRRGPRERTWRSVPRFKRCPKKKHLFCLFPNVAPPLLPYVQNLIQKGDGGGTYRRLGV